MVDALAGFEDTMMRSSAVTSAKLETLRKAQERTDQKLSETDDRLKAFVDEVECTIGSGCKHRIKHSPKKSTKRH
jgi:hypothetical protein